MGQELKQKHCCLSSCVQGTVVGASAVCFLKKFCLFWTHDLM